MLNVSISYIFIETIFLQPCMFRISDIVRDFQTFIIGSVIFMKLILYGSRKFFTLQRKTTILRKVYKHSRNIITKQGNR